MKKQIIISLCILLVFGGVAMADTFSRTISGKILIPGQGYMTYGQFINAPISGETAGSLATGLSTIFAFGLQASSPVDQDYIIVGSASSGTVSVTSSASTSEADGYWWSIGR